ncbi:NOP5/NOP56 family protein [Halobaculum sp. MBLA0147]|uniref:NOP5/NOP56 family protein n=1 Tax=Halobaculum sp. MBLA0147 TaxID=3079934 RepID=UPI003525E004
MTDEDADTGADAAWFAGDDGSPSDRVRTGGADAPADWPALAVERGVATDTDDYESRLRAATREAARETVRERERADDQQLIHAVRAMDDARRTANELAERVTEWGGSLFDLDPETADTTADEEETTAADVGVESDEADAGVAYARALARRDPEGPAERRVVSLAARVAAVADEADALAAYVAEHAPTVAPNLAALAGSRLAARLLSLAGGLEELAKQPSGTLQVLGAEDALFAHLRGNAPSPKHGVIYTHDYVRNTHPDDRGSAARALAGKLSIAARVDHYAGDRRPELERELDERIRTIRARTGGGDGE